jgi:DNA primase
MANAPSRRRDGARRQACSSLLDEQYVASVLQAVSIVDVISRHVELKRAGTVHKGLCPFHNEDSPSFTVTPARGTYHCFGCGAHGDVVQFYSNVTGSDFRTAVMTLGREAGLPDPDLRSDPDAPLLNAVSYAVEHYVRALAGRSGAEVMAYLMGPRGLSHATIERFSLGLAPRSSTLAARAPEDLVEALRSTGILKVGEDGKVRDMLAGRLVIPIRDRHGRFVALAGRALDVLESKSGSTAGSARHGVKYLNTNESRIYNKKASFYGHYEALQDLRAASARPDAPPEPALVVEGYFDVMALHQHGIPGAIGVSGTSINETHLRMAMDLSPSVILCMDGDKAGRRAVASAITTVLPVLDGRKTVSVVRLPDGRDPDEIIINGGADAFRALIRDATPLSRALLDVSGIPHGANGEGHVARAALPPEVLSGRIIRLRELLGLIRSDTYRSVLAAHYAGLLGLGASALEPILADDDAPKGANTRAAKAARAGGGGSGARVASSEPRVLSEMIRCLILAPAIAQCQTLPDGLAEADVPGVNALRAFMALLACFPGEPLSVVLDAASAAIEIVHSEISEIARVAPDVVDPTVSVTHHALDLPEVAGVDASADGTPEARFASALMSLRETLDLARRREALSRLMQDSSVPTADREPAPWD